MYFWNIRKLKADMVARPFSDREVLPYLLWTLGLLVAMSSLPPVERYNAWDYLDSAFSVAMTVGGTIYVFIRNGGTNGRDFLARFFAIGWVVMLRWLVTVLAIAIPFYIIEEFFGTVENETQWYEFVVLSAAEAGLYWRFGIHVGDIAKHTDTL